MSKLKFQVVHFSSEELGYPAEELNIHGPTTKGWQSSKLCTYPQEIIVELTSGEARITQLQLLSHQSKISSKVEIFIGDDITTFKRLGYLTLDTNEKSNFQARELKTVYIDCVGRFFKFIFQKNYVNSHNYYSQVGVVAINLVGTDTNNNDISSNPVGARNKSYAPQVSNPLNDLSIDMNLDPQTTSKLRNLSEAKLRAVETEDYITAKKIKSVENDLKDLGTRLAQLEIAKRKAVENEDYDQAKDLKDECDSLREDIENKITSINIPGVTNVASNSKKQPVGLWKSNENSTGKKPYSTNTDAISGQGSGYQSNYSKGPERDIDTNPQLNDYTTPSKLLDSSNRRSSVKSEVKDVDEDYADDEVYSRGISQDDGEDRPIRPKSLNNYDDVDPNGNNEELLYHSNANSNESFPRGQHPLEGVTNYLDLPSPEELSGKSKELSDQGIINLIGEYRARCLFSKNWSLRSAALNKVIDMLATEFTSSSQQGSLLSCLPVLCSIIRVGSDDRMQQVFLDAMLLLEKLLSYLPKQRITRTQVGNLMDPIFVILVEKTSDSNARIKDGAKKSLDLVLNSPSLGPNPLISIALKQLNSKQQSNWRTILSRLKLLHDILVASGVGNNNGLTVDSVMSFAKNLNAFQHGNGEVRDIAKDITVTLYHMVGRGPLQVYLDELRKKQLDEYDAAFGNVNGNPNPTVSAAAGSKSQKPAQSSAAGNSGSKSSQPQSKSSNKSGSTNESKSIPASSSSNTNNAVNKDNQPGAEEEDRNFTVCMFCGESDPRWNEDALDLHFWKSCPLLTPCPGCTQVVEIAGLPEHLLEECEHKANYVACEVTGLAILREDKNDWDRSKNCRAPPDNCIYCPLCLSTVEDTDEAWKQHLTQGCPKNARTQS